jgi:RNA polymerase sigma-70 factor (ECF subfamily)
LRADPSEVEHVAAADDVENLSDEELMRLISLRSMTALEALYDRYSGAVYSLAARMLRDTLAAEEVTQDAFFSVWRRASSYHPERGKVTAWLFSIGHHRIIDEVRRRRRRQQMQVNYDVELVDQPADDSNDPVRFAAVQMQRGTLDKALSTLRKEQREVVVLAYFGGLTHSEIASRLDQPLGTVKTRMRLALKKLREVLGPQAREWAEHGL